MSEWKFVGTTDDGGEVYIRPLDAECKSVKTHGKNCLERRLELKHMCRWCQERG